MINISVEPLSFTHQNIKGKHKMFKKLKELLQGVITKTNRQSALESFISSKNPTSPAEIEHWVRTFDRQSGGRYGY